MMREQIAPSEPGARQTRRSAREGEDALAARGDKESFVILYRGNVYPVYRYLFARLGNAQDAEDVTAQTFERAWMSLARYKANGVFKSWLFTIAQRTLVDHYRRQKPRELPLDDAEELRDSTAGLEESAIASEQVREVLLLIRGLNTEQQEVLALRFGGELAYDEIARVMNKRESAVKMIAYRALEEIRKRGNDV